MTEEALSTYQVSPRRALRPGLTFRTIKGSGPTFNGRPVGEDGRYRCLRLYRVGRGGRRLYCVATNLRTGATHDLFLDGRPFTSSTTGIRQRPFRIKLT